MSGKLTLAAVLVCLLFAGLFMWERDTRKQAEEDAAKAQGTVMAMQAQILASKVVLLEHQKKLAVLEQEKGQAQKELREVLKNEKDWADTALPNPVRELFAR